MTARRRAVAALLAAVALTGLAGLAAVAGGEAGRSALTPARSTSKRALGAWRRWRRAAGAAPERPLDRLAASQVGYGPGMAKRFTSPAPFTAFRVVREADGVVALEGGAPVRRVETDVLGDARAAWIGDFSALRTPGRYRIEASNGLASHPFAIGADAFDAAVRAVQRSFYFQRAFTAVEPAYAEGPWVHPSDARLAPPGVVKGWHDAGDLTLYNASTAAALFWLLEAYSDFAPADDATHVPESGNGVPDLLDEARWGLEWLLSVQGEGGGFRNTTCQDRYGPYGTNAPERMPPYRDGEVGTLATARAAGTLAFAAQVFRPVDPAFAARCLGAARAGAAYLDAHPGEDSDGPSCPAMRRDGDRVVGRAARAYAAAGLLLATGEARWREAFDRDLGDLARVPSPHRMEAYAARLYLRAPAGDPARKRALRERMRALADEGAADGARHPFEWASQYAWGSVGDGFHRATYGARACLDGGRAADCDQAVANVHYALGRNALHFCYVSGLPGVAHGLSWSFHHWLRALDASPHDFPGMVAGGPNAAPEPEDRSFPAARPFPVWGYWDDPSLRRGAATPLDARYTDNDSWSTNEIDILWQAVALYDLYFARWMARRG